MRKLTFFWRELHGIAPVTVERCACVWMINGARAQIRSDLAKQVRAEIAADQGKAADDITDDPSIDESIQVSIQESVEEIMLYLDNLHKHDRRILLGVLLGAGLVLTLQPWLALNFFSLPMMLAGAMLLGLEFSPRTGLGFVGMAKRLKKDFGSDKS